MKIARTEKKTMGRPLKKDPLNSALSVKLPKSAMERLKELAINRRLPMATLVRNHLLDWLDAQQQG